MTGQNIPNNKQDANEPKKVDQDAKNVVPLHTYLDLLQNQIDTVAQLPDVIAGKPVEKVRTNLARFYEVLKKYCMQSRCPECDTTNIVFVLLECPNTLLIRTLDGWIPAQSVRQGDICGFLLFQGDIFKVFAPNENWGISGGVYASDPQSITTNPTACYCGPYLLKIDWIYQYAGGTTFNQIDKVFDHRLENCTMFSFNESGGGDDFDIDDYRWHDVYALILQMARNDDLEVKSWLSYVSLLSETFWGNIYTPTLEAELYSTLMFSDILSGVSVGRDMVNRFISGEGGIWVHNAGSDLSNAVSASPEFINMLENIKEFVRVKLVEKEGMLSCSDLQMSRNQLTLFFEKWNLAVGWPIGGIQGLEVRILDLKVLQTGLFDLTLEITIYDDFGVGDADLYVPPLVAFWILQHVKEVKGNHTPFINKIIVRHTFERLVWR